MQRLSPSAPAGAHGDKHPQEDVAGARCVDRFHALRVNLNFFLRRHEHGAVGAERQDGGLRAGRNQRAGRLVKDLRFWPSATASPRFKTKRSTRRQS